MYSVEIAVACGELRQAVTMPQWAKLMIKHLSSKNAETK